MTRLQRAAILLATLCAVLTGTLAAVPPAQAAGFCVYHHTPDSGAAGAFVLQKPDGSIVYAGQGQRQCGVSRWYVPSGESVWCQQADGVGAFQYVFGPGWHQLGQNWNSCVTHVG